MVVLLRAFTHVDAYEEALDRAGLAPYVVGGRGYWSQQQVEDALRLLGVIANPLDDELLFGALASPACGASPDALWLLRQAARSPEGRPLHVWPTVEAGEWPAAIPADDTERLGRFREILAGLRSEAPLLPLDSLIDRTISAFDYDLALLARPGGRRRMANVRKLMRLAAEYEEHEGRNLRGFLEFAEERTLRDEREGMAAVQVEGHDGVRVMTVHAAKGLQFPVVAVADLGRGLGTGSRDGDVVIGRIEGTATQRAPHAGGCGARPVRHAAADRSRRVHSPLGAGRALRGRAPSRHRGGLPARLRGGLASRGPADPQRHLPLVRPRSPRGAEGDALGAEAAAPGAPRARLGRRRGIGRARAGDGDRGRPLPGTGSRGSRCGPRPRARSGRPSFAAGCPGQRRAADGAPDRGQAHLLEGLEPAPAAGHLSYAALATYSGCHYRFYVERVIGLEAPTVREEPREGDDDGERPQADELPAPATGPRERSLAIGNAVHAALEASARRSWAPPDGAELETILAREGLGGDGEARDRVEALVEGWLSSELRAELEASGARIRPEVPFVLGLGGAVVRGKIDLLAERPEGPLVVDYKTDALRGADPAELAERYETQRDLYALAVHGARRNGAAAIVARRLLLPRGPRADVGRGLRRGQGRRGARAPRATRRGDPRRRLRAHRQPPPRALLRLPGGGAAVREAGLAAPVGGLVAPS